MVYLEVNKYWEAIKHIENGGSFEDLKDDIETLKELVLENEYLKACLNESIMRLQAIEGIDKLIDEVDKMGKK